MLKQLLVPAVAALALVLPASGTAHPNHSKKILGTVTMAAPDHVMVKTPDGKEQTIAIDAKTKLLKGKTKVRIEDVKVGTRVVISLTPNEPPTAAEIQVGAAPAAAKK
jgi:hypothetical protein